MLIRFISACSLVLLLASAAGAGNGTNVDRAKLLFEAGRLLYQQGDYRGAAENFSAGYEEVPQPLFLLNMGQCFRRLNDLARARELFLRYLKETRPDDPQRKVVPQLIAEIDSALAARADAARVEVPPPEAPHAAAAAPDLSPPAQTVSSPNASAATGAQRISPFAKRHWWIFPVAAVVLSGLAVGIYFAVRPDPCGGVSPCVKLQ